MAKGNSSTGAFPYKKKMRMGADAMSAQKSQAKGMKLGGQPKGKGVARASATAFKEFK